MVFSLPYTDRAFQVAQVLYPLPSGLLTFRCCVGRGPPSLLFHFSSRLEQSSESLRAAPSGSGPPTTLVSSAFACPELPSAAGQRGTTTRALQTLQTAALSPLPKASFPWQS